MNPVIASSLTNTFINKMEANFCQTIIVFTKNIFNNTELVFDRMFFKDETVPIKLTEIFLKHRKIVVACWWAIVFRDAHFSLYTTLNTTVFYSLSSIKANKNGRTE